MALKAVFPLSQLVALCVRDSKNRLQFDFLPANHEKRPDNRGFYGFSTKKAGKLDGPRAFRLP
jgi:hypothetical protein